MIYTCYCELTRSGDDFISNHMLGIILGGSLTVINGNEIKTYRRNEVLLYQKNKLAKFIKQPENGKPFESIAVIFDEPFLSEYGQRNNIAFSSSRMENIDVLTELNASGGIGKMLKKLLGLDQSDLVSVNLLKQRIMSKLILENPEVKLRLFDFSKPWKIEMEPFMNRNYRYKLSLEQMAYLTGRSLAAFKRDFKAIFNSSPGKWVQSKRLEEAYFLIYEKGRKPADIYFDLGFETLSHFSYAFKKFFGINASALAKNSPIEF